MGSQTSAPTKQKAELQNNNENSKINKQKIIKKINYNNVNIDKEDNKFDAFIQNKMKQIQNNRYDDNCVNNQLNYQQLLYLTLHALTQHPQTKRYISKQFFMNLLDIYNSLLSYQQQNNVIQNVIIYMNEQKKQIKCMIIVQMIRYAIFLQQRMKNTNKKNNDDVENNYILYSNMSQNMYMIFKYAQRQSKQQVYMLQKSLTSKYTQYIKNIINNKQNNMNNMNMSQIISEIVRICEISPMANIYLLCIMILKMQTKSKSRQKQQIITSKSIKQYIQSIMVIVNNMLQKIVVMRSNDYYETYIAIQQMMKQHSIGNTKTSTILYKLKITQQQSLYKTMVQHLHIMQEKAQQYYYSIVSVTYATCLNNNGHAYNINIHPYHNLNNRNNNNNNNDTYIRMMMVNEQIMMEDVFQQSIIKKMQSQYNSKQAQLIIKQYEQQWYIRINTCSLLSASCQFSHVSQIVSCLWQLLSSIQHSQINTINFNKKMKIISIINQLKQLGHINIIIRIDDNFDCCLKLILTQFSPLLKITQQMNYLLKLINMNIHIKNRIKEQEQEQDKNMDNSYEYVKYWYFEECWNFMTYIKNLQNKISSQQIRKTILQTMTMMETIIIYINKNENKNENKQPIIVCRRASKAVINYINEFRNKLKMINTRLIYDYNTNLLPAAIFYHRLCFYPQLFNKLDILKNMRQSSSAQSPPSLIQDIWYMKIQASIYKLFNSYTQATDMYKKVLQMYAKYTKDKTKNEQQKTIKQQRQKSVNKVYQQWAQCLFQLGHYNQCLQICQKLKAQQRLQFCNRVLKNQDVQRTKNQDTIQLIKIYVKTADALQLQGNTYKAIKIWQQCTKICKQYQIKIWPTFILVKMAHSQISIDNLLEAEKNMRYCQTLLKENGQLQDRKMSQRQKKVLMQTCKWLALGFSRLSLWQSAEQYFNICINITVDLYGTTSPQYFKILILQLSFYLSFYMKTDISKGQIKDLFFETLKQCKKIAAFYSIKQSIFHLEISFFESYYEFMVKGQVRQAVIQLKSIQQYMQKIGQTNNPLYSNVQLLLITAYNSIQSRSLRNKYIQKLQNLITKRFMIEKANQLQQCFQPIHLIMLLLQVAEICSDKQDYQYSLELCTKIQSILSKAGQKIDNQMLYARVYAIQAQSQIKTKKYSQAQNTIKQALRICQSNKANSGVYYARFWQLKGALLIQNNFKAQASQCIHTAQSTYRKIRSYRSQLNKEQLKDLTQSIII